MSDIVERLRHWMPIDLEDARWMRNAAADRIEALEAALREIARQMTTREMSKEELDVEGAYNALIGIARAALAPE